MAWTYTNDPANVTRDQVRLLIGDIDSDDPQLTDEEVDFFISDAGNAGAAAIAATRALIALYARLVDKAVGDLRLSYSRRHEHYKGLLDELKARHAMRVAGPVAGGISRARKDTVEDDSDRVVPAFSRRQFDHPGTNVDDEDPDWEC